MAEDPSAVCLKVFAATSTAALNFGAFVQNHVDLQDKKIGEVLIYFNFLFLFFEVLQIICFAIGLNLMCNGKVRSYIIITWIEDGLLEGIMVILGIIIGFGTNAPMSNVLVIMGGLISLAVAIIETRRECKGNEKLEDRTLVKSTSGLRCLKCCCWCFFCCICTLVVLFILIVVLAYVFADEAKEAEKSIAETQDPCDMYENDDDWYNWCIGR